MSDCCHADHPDHRPELGKLNRVAGQIEGIKKMITDGRYCPDILIQLRASRAALKTIEAAILERHLHACVAEAMQSRDKGKIAEKIDELKEIFKRYD